MREPPRIVRTAHLENLRPLLEFTEKACAELGLDGDAGDELKLAVEEVCMNLILHGYPPAPPGPIDLSIAAADGQVIVEVRDQARPFDPAQAPAPDLESGWEQRRVGGLGWHLVRQMVDEIRYESSAVGNRLTLVKRSRAA